MITIHLGRVGTCNTAVTRNHKPETRNHRPWPLKTISLWLAAALAISLVLLASAGCSQTAPAAMGVNSAAAVQADSRFERAAHRPPTAQTLFAEARILEIQGRDNVARVVLYEIIHRYPDFLPVYSDLAELQVRHRQIGLAVDTLNAGLQLAPHDGLLLNDRGMCRLITKRYAAALKDFTLATACQPANTRYRANLALTLGLMGKYKQSLSVYRLILSPADAHYDLGVVCQARHDAAEAAKQFALARTRVVDP